MGSIAERSLRSIEYYSDGVKLTGNKIKGKGNKNPSKRGKVKDEWSSPSRRRFRMRLLQFTAIEGYDTYDATLTIPGYPLNVNQTRELWTDFCNRANMDKWAVTWRMEIQERGQAHFHTMISVPQELANPEQTIMESWWKALSRLGKVYYAEFYPLKYQDYIDKNYNGILINGWPDLSTWKGAKWVKDPSKPFCTPSVEVRKTDGQSGAWKRYLQDHATKKKQGQIAKGFGRHWGVVGRNKYQKNFPDEVIALSQKEFNTFLRFFQRLTTPSIRNEKVPFGRALGQRNRRGSWGQSVWYSNPSTVKALMEWSISMHSEA